MRDVVIDTNVLISSFYSSNSPPAKVMDLVDEEAVTVYFSEEIIQEYKDVLAREKHKISVEAQFAFSERGFYCDANTVYTKI